jgi:hypothetical protein
MTKDNTDDAALIAALNNASEPARRCFEHYANQERLGVWLERPSPDIEEIKRPIVVAMETHNKFRIQVTLFFESKQFAINAQFQSHNILRVAIERGAAAAVAWYHKLYSTERADIRYVAEVYGLKVSERLNLSNGVSLMPLCDLPPSASANAVQMQFTPRPGNWNWPTISMPTGAAYEVPGVVGHPKFDESVPPRSDILETTIRAFTLVEKAAPVIGTSWLEFVDADLAMAEFGRMRTVPLYEGRPSWFPVDVDQDAVEWVMRYLRLAHDLRPQCNLAIERLNLARRRLSAGDRAIDGGICLEALLGDNNNQEITYRLSLRTALMLSKDLKERHEISKDVKEFYNLRSKAVHGAQIKLKEAQINDACAARGLDICAQVLKKIVKLEKKYVAKDWELSGGEL